MPKASPKILRNISSLHRQSGPLYKLITAGKVAARDTIPRSPALSQRAATILITDSVDDEQMFSVTRQIVSTTTLAITVTLLLTKIGLAQRPAPPSLVVTSSTSIAFSGPPGGPFSPRSVEYRVSASSGSVRYFIRTPSWLTA